MVHKYRAKPTTIDGIRFASKKEAGRYVELRLLEKAHEVFGLVLQPKYLLGTNEAPVLMRSDRYPNGRRASYIADFRYYTNIEGTKMVVEDVKGMDTPLSKLKRAMVEAQYGIRVVLV